MASGGLGGHPKAGGLQPMTVTVQGTDELRAALRDVSARVATNALRSAIRSAARLVIASAKSRVTVRTGRLRKSISQRVSVKRGLVQTKIGFLRKGYYGQFVELGYVIKAHGRIVGSVSARPFLRPALAENESLIADMFAGMVRAEIAKRRAKGQL